MNSFEYLSVSTVDDACGALAQYGAEASVLAGGTDLLIGWRRLSAKTPRAVVDISQVGELRGILETEAGIVLKPLTTHRQLLHSGLLQQFAPLLASAAGSVGSPQIRSRGTVGGNLMNAATCADTVPPLVALGATVILQTRTASRKLELADLYVKPYQTRANPEELLTQVEFPKLPPNARGAFIKLGRRNALSISRLSVATILRLDGSGRIAEARIVPGAAFPTWKRVTAAEQMLLGEKPAAKLFAAAGLKVSEEMIKETGRRWSTEYKEPVIAILVRRALEQCARRSADGSVRAAGRKSNSRTKASALPHEAQRPSRTGVAHASKEVLISTTINGRACTLAVPARRTLLELLRDQLGLTGTKCGCEIGECGACTVLLDGQPVNSCLVLAAQIDGREVLTIEGLARNGKLHPLQESFLDHDAVHCGFCTPGMLLSAKALLDWNPRPTGTEIRTAISGNLCRCTGYQQIVQAIAKASSA